MTFAKKNTWLLINIALACVLLVSVLFVVGARNKVDAGHNGCSPVGIPATRVLGVCINHGYWTNTGYDPVFIFGSVRSAVHGDYESGIWYTGAPGTSVRSNPGKLNAFINRMRTDINRSSSDASSTENQRRLYTAAFFINTMMNKPGSDFSNRTDGLRDARNNFAEWERLLRFKASRGQVHWEYKRFTLPEPVSGIVFNRSLAGGNPDGTLINNGADVQDMYWITNTSHAFFTTLRIDNGSNNDWEMKLNCGNLTGAIEGFEIAERWRTASPQPSSNRTITAYPGETKSVGFGVSNPSSVPTRSRNSSGGRIGVQATENVWVNTITGAGPSLRPAGSSTTFIGKGNFEIGASSSDNWAKNYVIPITAREGERFCVSASYNRREGYFNGPLIDPRGQQSGTVCIEVQDFPFMKVHGSGVWNGATWANIFTCRNQTVSTPALPGLGAGIESQFSPVPANNSIGSSTQYGVTSLVTAINQFASASLPGTDIDTDGRLSFASEYPGVLGKMLGDSTSPSRCIVNLFNELYDPGLTAVSDSASLNGRNTFAGSENTAKAAELIRYNAASFDQPISGYRGKVVIVRDGDLTINQNIEYDENNFGTGDNPQIPSIVVIVNGKITIAPGVNRIDGLYIAAENDISTCSRADVISGAVRLNPACENELQVNGAFIANDIDFYRFGLGFQDTLVAGADQQDNFASETFRFSPELYISNPFAGLLNFMDVTGQRYDNFEEKAPVF